MDVGVAIEAGASIGNAACSCPCACARIETRETTLMRCWFVALLTEEGGTCLEQVVDGRAMRVMADRAVFCGFVFADKGATFFHVAAEAGVSDAISFH